MAKKVMLWVLIGLTGLYLMFRAITPFWVDMLFIVVGGAWLVLYKIYGGDNDKKESDPSPPASGG